ncbi:hypothetical protein F4780DRAFT_775270 [Xylariomycetidae sp. FL0641]|nr:hypothetical protein F4780DRAFT_775270 [Xylariomycetidae sp. FL0641]
MSRTLEPTLLSLLPTYSTALPQPLLELASSLLAQSRHSAGVLKAEEEVARSYACAHIACERLKITLDLPPIRPRPPIPPRIYKRLYTHLDHVLPAASVGKSPRVRTPSSKLRDSGSLFSGGGNQRTPSRSVPSKDDSLAQFRSPAAKGTSTPARSGNRQPPRLAAKKKAGGPTSALPAWVRPVVQLLCKELDGERIGRTVLAGMQTIVAPHGKRTKDEWVNENLTSLLAAVYCVTSSQVYVLEQGKDLDARQYTRMRKSILRTLEVAPEKIVMKDMDEDELWIGWADIGTKDVDLAIAKVIESGWQKEEWFAGIKYLVDAQHSENDGEADVTMEDGDEARMGEELHIQRADTMFQSRWDMTDRKRAEYREWRESILQQIVEIEQNGAGEV